MNKKIVRLAAGTLLVTAIATTSVPVYAASNENNAAVPVASVIHAPAFTYLTEQVNQPWGLAAASDGSIIIVSAGGNQIWKWQNSKLTPITSQTEGGLLDGAASAATFQNPTYAAVNSQGVIYVSDTENHVIRRITNDKVFTAVGNGVAGYKDGKFGAAQFNAPAGLVIDAEDNIYVADTLNHVIRKITPEGVTSTIAGTAADTGGYRDGSATEAQFNEPMGLALDEKGGLYVADSGNHLIRYILDGKVTTIAGKTTAVDEFTGYMEGGYVNGAGSEARFNRPRGLAYSDGVLFIADSLNNRIRAIQPNGRVISIAGQSAPGNSVGAAAEAQFNQPSSLLYTEGKLYVSDTLNNSIKVLGVNPQALQSIRTEEDLLAGTELLPAAKAVQVWFDGKQVKFPQATQPFKSGNKLYIPVRTTFAAGGANVKWNATTKSVQLTKGDWKLTLQATPDRTVLLKKDIMYIEASYLKKTAALFVVRDEEYNALIINSGQ